MNAPTKTGFDWSRPRKGAVALFFLCGTVLSVLCFRFIGGYLFLGHRYGFARVQAEHLRLLKMGKGDPWIVSNGDKVPGPGFLWFLVISGIFLALFLAVFLGAYRLLPEKEERHAA
jgi:hypothetical protein